MTGNFRTFGYTSRESGFLAIAALQSGYFLRRHFNSYVGRECGALGQQFLARALRLGHVDEMTGWGNRVVYHVGAREVYARLGDADNRNRRLHRPDTIRQRLMMLDYVIARPSEGWLLTGDERRALWAGLRGREPDALPHKPTAKVSHPDDRQPLSVDAHGQARIAFIDAGLRGFSEWERFLKRHREGEELRKATVIYSSCDPARFSLAESLFNRVVRGTAADGGIEVGRLCAYFTARRLFEERRYEQFDQARLDRLREDRRVYGGEEFEQAYVRWQQEGEAALSRLQGAETTLECQILPHAYVWLSPIRFQERRPDHGSHSSADKENSRSNHGEA
jgi:hypothetical protein